MTVPLVLTLIPLLTAPQSSVAVGGERPSPPDPATSIAKAGQRAQDNSMLTLAERRAMDAEASQPRLLAESPEELAGIEEAHGAPRGILSSAALAGHERLYLDTEPDGAIWASGTRYKSRFDETGATYIPFLGSKAPRNFPLSFEAPRITLAGEELPTDRLAAPQLRGERAVFNRGAVQERYDLRVGEIEQLFIFDSLPSRGEIQVRIPFTTDLEPADSDGHLRFMNKLGGVSYSHAIAFDASGASVNVSTERTESEILLTVPASFVAKAELPLTIDPVISTIGINISSQDDRSPDIAYDAATQLWMIVWQRTFSSSDRDIFAQTFDGAGNPVFAGGTYIENSSEDWVAPRVANNAAQSQFLIVAQRNGTVDQIWGRTRSAGSTQMGPQFPISFDFIDCRAPDVGGDPSLSGSSFYCVVWERYVDLGVNHDIYTRIVRPDSTTFGNPYAIDGSTGTYDKVPSISRSVGTGPEGTRTWNVVWQRQYSSTDWDIWGSQLGRFGTIVAPSFSIDLSVADDRWPDASSNLDGNGIVFDRQWMTVYERRSSDGIDDIWASAMRGSSRTHTRNLSTLFGAGESQDQVQPCVDSNGNAFAVAWTERFGSSASNFNVLGGSLYLAAGQIRVAEGPIGLQLDPRFNLHVEMCARRSGGEDSDLYGLVWRDINTAAGNESNIEGLIYESPPHYGNGIGVNYCSALANSTGLRGAIHASGSANAGPEPLGLRAFNLPMGVFGYFIASPNAGNSLPASSSGRVCLGNPLSRFNAPDQIRNTGGSNNFSLLVDTEAIPLPTGGTTALGAGQTYRFQAWFRDGSTNNFTDGVSVLFY